MLTGTGFVIIYAGVSVAAMLGRINRTTTVGHYRMPLYPLWPALSLVVLAGVAWAELLDPDDGRPEPDRQRRGDGAERRLLLALLASARRLGPARRGRRAAGGGGGVAP